MGAWDPQQRVPMGCGYLAQAEALVAETVPQTYGKQRYFREVDERDAVCVAEGGLLQIQVMGGAGADRDWNPVVRQPRVLEVQVAHLIRLRDIGLEGNS